MTLDPQKRTIGSLGVIREILDHARTVKEALTIFEKYHISMEGGSTLHYLVADKTGKSALVEFFQGIMSISTNEAQPWLTATNFVVAATGSSP